MQLTNISISALAFDNQPFTRSLTATLMNTVGSQTVQASGSSEISWFYPFENTYALMPNGSAYERNKVAPVSTIGTMCFYFSASPYDYKTTNYTLCTLRVEALYYSSDPNIENKTANYSLCYDTFPNIDFSLFINYENTNDNSLFYRTTSNNPLTANIALRTSNYNLAIATVSSSYATWFTINNSTTKNYLSTATYEFIRTLPSVSSVQAYLTASTAPGALSAWYTPHSIKKDMSAVFVPAFPVASFIAYPSSAFVSPEAIELINTSNYDTQSPGVCFYGEGHTENILLCASNVGDYNYVWTIDKNQFNLVRETDTTAYVTITSKQDFYPKLPISLILSNNDILSSGPTYYIDDATGKRIYYPFYATTIDLSGNELSSNTKFNQSIAVNPYDAVFGVEFIPGIPGITDTVYLPLNGSKRDYLASLRIIINNPDALSACFDKHNTFWQWSTFTGCSSLSTNPLSSTLIASPSTWTTVECSGNRPKKWVREGLSDTLAKTPINCSLSTVIWRLSAYTPSRFKADIPISLTPIENISTFPYSLQLSGNDLNLIPPDSQAGFTVSRTSNTQVVLQAEQTVYCQITTTLPFVTVNDWPLKETKLLQTYSFTSIKPYALNIYTSNKYVPVNTPIVFENLFERVTNALTGVEIIVDEFSGYSLYLTGDQIDQSFTVTYSSAGFKNIKITGYSPFYEDTFTQEFPNIVRVVNSYDTVIPEAFYTIDRILLDLPWKEQPAIGPNDWVVSDNINSCIKMFYDNLNYLDKRNNTYLDTYNEYYGWLGSEPTVIQDITACPVWTWEDATCLDANSPNYISWSLLMSGGLIPEVNETGSLAYCGTWEQQTCPLSSVVPNCLGKHCIEWKWASRKSFDSTALVTWKDTSLSGRFEKTWKQPLEECETVRNVNCDEGVWNVDIPGLNTYYDPIPDCYSQNRCSYSGILSYNNILYLAQDTQLKLLSSNRTATFFDLRTTFNEASPFITINSIAMDSQKKIYILDSTLSQVAVYIYNASAPGERWTLFTTFGGVGGSLSKTKFNNPTEIHIDRYDNIWIVDTGNSVLKQYTNTGSWVFTLRDDSYFKQNPPIGVCVDSTDKVHVLTSSTVRVYSYRGEFLFEYKPGKSNSPLTGLHKIATSHNREIIYIATKSKVIRHFRTGTYSGTIIDSKQCVDNINGMFHDEYRNLLVINDNKVLKFVDTMTVVPLKGQLPSQYWTLNDLLIHDEEYVQNWVYTKALHRVWDNIEIFRNTLLYNDTGTCKRYKPPIYSKDKITIGQNEIVTSTVINRALGYLWENFKVLLEYYDPNC